MRAPATRWIKKLPTHGDPRDYRKRFYDPYKSYPAPIVSIAGNHDGYGSEDSDATTLDGWTEHFLGPCPAERRSSYRPPMELPYVHWELRTPVLTILGLYSNIDGHLDAPDGAKPGWRHAMLTLGNPSGSSA